MPNIYTQLVTDSFQRANQLPLDGPNWFGSFNNNPRLQLFNNQVFPRVVGANASAMWNLSSLIFPADQYAESKINVLPTANLQEFGVTCREADDGGGLNNAPMGYAFKLIRGVTASTWSYAIHSFHGGSSIVLASLSGAPIPVVGDFVRLEAQSQGGSKVTLTGFYNGVQQLQTTDFTYVSGQTGLIMNGFGATRPGTKLFNAGSIVFFNPIRFNSARSSPLLISSAVGIPGDLWLNLANSELFVAVAAGAQFLPGTSDAQNVTNVWRLGLNVITCLRAAVPIIGPIGTVYLTTDTLEAFIASGSAVFHFNLNVGRALRGAPAASITGVSASSVPVFFVPVDS